MYIDNKELYDWIVSWKQQLATDPNSPMPNNIGQAIMLIAEQFTNYWRFVRYTDDWKELMVGDAIETCVKNLRCFDADKYSNPHAYITMICYRCFINRIRLEKKRTAAKYKYFIEHVFDFDDEDMAKLVDVNFYNDMAEKVNEIDNMKPAVVKKKEQPIGISWLED